MNKILLITALLLPLYATAGNQNIESIDNAEELLETQIHFDHQETLYCGASFDDEKNITLPEGFDDRRFPFRTLKMEWDHIVPIEDFGRNFTEWTKGDRECVTEVTLRDGEVELPYKGMLCAQKASEEYRLMKSDLHNLHPAIGSVNAIRSNNEFTNKLNNPSEFGSCLMKVSNRYVEPPVNSRGVIARTYMYMDEAYSNFKMSRRETQLMKTWDRLYPTTEWECIRGQRIDDIQGSYNRILESRCDNLK